MGSLTGVTMSALPPKADIEMGAALRLLVTPSGHSNAKDDLRYDTLIINKRLNSAFHSGAGIF